MQQSFAKLRSVQGLKSRLGACLVLRVWIQSQSHGLDVQVEHFALLLLRRYKRDWSQGIIFAEAKNKENFVLVNAI